MIIARYACASPVRPGILRQGYDQSVSVIFSLVLHGHGRPRLHWYNTVTQTKA